MLFLDKFVGGLAPRYDDDAVDRLNYYFTPMILAIFSIFLSAKQYWFGTPIQCWVPAQFTGPWEQYCENYCFVQNTYFLPMKQYIPQDYAERDRREIGYYQWVPVVLAIQAVLFYLPCLLWRLLNWQSGITVKAAVNMAQDVANMDKDNRDKHVATIAAHLFDCLDMQRSMRPKNPATAAIFYGRHYGSFVFGLYLLTKFLYLIQVIVQFFILNAFLGTSYTFWGFEILRDLIYGREWEESGHFPRVTMCDFEVRVLGNLHRWTVQCVLMINMFHEKNLWDRMFASGSEAGTIMIMIYLFLWWWFLLVAVCTAVSLIMWVVSAMGKQQQIDFVHRYLRVSGSVGDDENDRKLLRKFVNQCLRPDGVFLLRIVASNAGDLITTDIVHELFVKYLDRAKAQALPAPGLLKEPASPPPPRNRMHDIDDVDHGPRGSPGNEEKVPLADQET